MTPYAPKKPCIGSPRCPLFALPGKARCEAHQRAYYQQDNARREPEIRAFYDSPAWRRLSAAYRAEHPLCETCATEGRETPSQHVDHVISVREAPDRALDETNLRALCKPCHSRRTLAERRP